MMEMTISLKRSLKIMMAALIRLRQLFASPAPVSVSYVPAVFFFYRSQSDPVSYAAPPLNDTRQEILDHPLSVFRVDGLGVELETDHRILFVPHRHNLAVRRSAPVTFRHSGRSVS